MITFICPKCSTKVGVVSTPTAPVICTGQKLGPEGFFKAHTADVLCETLNEDGSRSKQTTTNNQRKTTTMPIPKEATNLCACYSVETNGVRTSCGRLVKGKFAPGHDAKLKGILIRAAVAGETLKLKDGDGKVTSVQPLAYAKTMGWDAIVAKGVQVATDKANRPKRERKPSANKVAKPAKVSTDELKARAQAKAAEKANKPKPTPAKAANAKKAAAAKAASLV